jgi:hypothetical protein
MENDDIKIPPDPEPEYMEKSNVGVLWGVLIAGIFVVAIVVIVCKAF